MRMSLVFALWAVLCLAVAAPVFGTVVLPADFETVVVESGVIVHGRVQEVRSAVAGTPRGIESYVTLAVIDALKGDPGSTVTFRIPSGQVGRYRRIVVGTPEFAAGDEVVVFLRGRAPAMPMLFGLSQGVYRVARDEAARPVVTTPVLVRSAGAERLVRGDPARQPIPLATFAREVRAVLERRR